MTTLGRYEKDPDARLDYSIDWSAWLAGDTIVDTEWLVPAELTIADPSPSWTTTVATIWLSGGTLGASYEVTCRVTTAAGRIDDRTITIVIVQK